MKTLKNLNTTTCVKLFRFHHLHFEYSHTLQYAQNRLKSKNLLFLVDVSTFFKVSKYLLVHLLVDFIFKSIYKITRKNKN